MAVDLCLFNACAQQLISKRRYVKLSDVGNFTIDVIALLAT